MVYRKFKDMDEKWQKQLFNFRKNELLTERKNCIKEFGEEKADNMYLTSLDYINNYKIEDSRLVVVCNNCGCPEPLMQCLSDTAFSYQTRKVVYKCKCKCVSIWYA